MTHRVKVDVYSDLDNFKIEIIKIEEIDNTVNFTFTSGEGEDQTQSYGLAVLETDSGGNEWFINPTSTTYPTDSPEYIIKRSIDNIHNIFISKFK